MGVSKVEFGGDTIVDLTNDTVTPNSLLSGYSAHNRAGELINGLVVIPTKVSELENDAGYISIPETAQGNRYLRDDGTWVAPSTNLLATEPGIPLDQTMGKRLKDDIDAVNSNLSLEAQKLTAIIDQMYYKKIARDSLKNNLLLVNLNTEYADANKTRIFNKPSSNAPIDNEYFMGIWICHWHSINHVMIELIEMYPVAGRRWTNFYNSTKWTGWHSITPQ